MSDREPTKERAELFRYRELEVTSSSLRASFELDGRRFVETVDFEGVGALDTPAGRSLAELWFLLAGLSYYKAGAARRVDALSVPLGEHGRRLLETSLNEGLAEFAYVNNLPLDDVVIEGGSTVTAEAATVDPNHVLVPFGGGIDSVVTTNELADDLDRALFIVSPSSGRFDPLEATAATTKLEIIRASRSLDGQLLRGDRSFFNGHVPVTAMVTLLAVVAAVASGRGGVVMSNEHSASSANVRWGDLDVNHQWSKSWRAEQLIARAVAERVGPDLVVASFLRDRSELWVAEVFSRLDQYHHVFRSCNRAFSQAVEARRGTWCGECDKCLFTNLVLAPFLSRDRLWAIFRHEPLSDPERLEQLRTLVGVGSAFKPFECVGDPGESAVALGRIAQLDEWSDVEWLAGLAAEASPDRTFDELFEPQGPSGVPSHWLR